MHIKWRFCVWFALMLLLLLSTSETRPLNPRLEKKNNLTSSGHTLAGSARELLNVWLRKQEANQTHHKPQRTSPGGPDPQHHSKVQ
ncbi:hypothetical protein Pyn_29315 [Prunus yedoensis var. nudiflora]|uniref:Uncharacterized protein n=1 Tax=Prunus yedoensis var. nudiflora TaxID=2094558 RepID=A0A314ZN21_PRUYE|nr:hypothetical protein Pyn_29315 [Prunus yedoensis var. nudiflora]